MKILLKNLIIASILLLVNLPSFITTCDATTDITVSGVVTEKDNTPLSNAKVSFISDLGETFSTFTDINGNYSVTLAIYTPVKEEKQPEFKLHQNYPNPFNPSTTIEFELKKSSDVRLDIYNITGQKIRTLESGYLQTGYHSYRWDGLDNKGRAVSAGVYIYSLKSDGFVQSKKMTLVDGGSRQSVSAPKQAAVTKSANYSNTIYEIIIEKEGYETYREIGFYIKDYYIWYNPKIKYDMNIFKKQTAFKILFYGNQFNSEFYLAGETLKVEAVLNLGFSMPDTLNVEIKTKLGDIETIMLHKGSGFAPRYDDCRWDTNYYYFNLEGTMPITGGDKSIIGNGNIEVAENDTITVTGCLSDSLMVTSSIPVFKEIRTEVVFDTTYKYWENMWHIFYRVGEWSKVLNNNIFIDYKDGATTDEINNLLNRYNLTVKNGYGYLIVPENTDPVNLLIELAKESIVEWAKTGEAICVDPN